MTTATTERAVPARPGIRLPHGLIARAPLLVFAVLFVYIAVRAPEFLDGQSIFSILRQSAPDAILACGLAVVVMAGGDDIVSGGIDLSLPAAATLGVAIMADRLVSGESFPSALALAVAAVLVVGVVNSVLVVVVGLTPLLATLATSVAVVGITKWTSANRRITVSDDTVATIRDGSVFGIPVPALFAFVVFVGFWFGIHRTRFGVRLQAVGGSRAATEISGLSVRRYLGTSFPLAGVAAAVAVVVLIARGSGLSPGIEDQLLLDMVLATFVGAAFSPRRVVTVPGAMLGALLVKALGSGFQLLSIDIFKVGMIKGFLILLVVASAAAEGRQR